jgi:sugar lactone lactonase YvrE
MADAMSAILETTQAERLATGFVFTEGPLWHPDGFYYFVDIRRSVLYRLTSGKTPELVRTETGEGNGTTFDLQGRLVMCEGGHRRVTRTAPDGRVDVLVDRYEGKRLNRPNDVVCKSDGSIWFTDPSYAHLQGFGPEPQLGDHVYCHDATSSWPPAGSTSPTGSRSRRTSPCSTSATASAP